METKSVEHITVVDFLCDALIFETFVYIPSNKGAKKQTALSGTPIYGL